MAEAMLEEGHRSSPLPDLKSRIMKPKKSADGSLVEKKKKQENSPRKQIAFKIPPKRQKLSPTATTRQVIAAISIAVSQCERLHSLAEAALSFDHNIESAHDDELAEGAGTVLTKHLGFLLWKKIRAEKIGDTAQSDPEVSISKEISQTVEVLEMVYRASVSGVADSFACVGGELLPLLIAIIDDELKERCRENGKTEQIKSDESDLEDEDDDQSQPAEFDSTENGTINSEEFGLDMQTDSPGSRPVTPPSPYIESLAEGGTDGDLALRKATKIIAHFARVSTITQQIACHRGLLSSLRKSAPSFIPFAAAIPFEARLNSLWTIANLACNTDNMVMMACHPELINMLVATLFRSPTEEDEINVVMEILRSHAIACRALHNLTWAPENKMPMSENASLVKALSRMVVKRVYTLLNRPHGISSVLLQTRRHAAGALRNLASAPKRNKVRLCQYGNGSLLDTLVDVAKHDMDVGVQGKAFSALHNLACVDTAEIMITKPALLSLLRETVGVFTGNVEDSSDGDTTKAEAQGTLIVLERTITEDMACYPILRDLLKEVGPPVKTDGEGSANEAEDYQSWT